MSINRFIIYYLLFSFLFLSCKSRGYNYMQNAKDIAVETSLKNAQTTLQPGDKLTIYVTAKDMDVAKPFNQNYSSGQQIRQDDPSGNTYTQPVSQSGPSYTVDSAGDIDFPVLGKISVLGKTAEELKTLLTTDLQRYIKTPIVNVSLTNFKITVLGEVNKPGDYYIPSGQATLLNALGMAGDLTVYGQRQNLMVVRNDGGQIVTDSIDLTNANLINSPYFYLKQNDVIYVNANKAKQTSSGFGPQSGIYISIASVILGLIAIFVK